MATRRRNLDSSYGSGLSPISAPDDLLTAGRLRRLGWHRRKQRRRDRDGGWPPFLSSVNTAPDRHAPMVEMLRRPLAGQRPCRAHSRSTGNGRANGKVGTRKANKHLPARSGVPTRWRISDPARIRRNGKAHREPTVLHLGFRETTSTIFAARQTSSGGRVCP